MNLFQEIQISELECYRKYNMFKEKCEKQPERIKILASMFGIDESNKIALFYILYGLNAVGQEVEYITNLMKKEMEKKNEELCGN